MKGLLIFERNDEKIYKQKHMKQKKYSDLEKKYG